MVNPNGSWSDVKDSGGMLPEGIYQVVVTEAEETMSKNGNPQWFAKYSVVSGAYAQQEQWDWISLHEKMLWKVKKLAKACGIDLDARGSGPFLPSEILNKAMRIRVLHESYEGKNRARVEEYMAIQDQVERTASNDPDPF